MQSDSIKTSYLIGVNKRTFLSAPFPAELNKKEKERKKKTKIIRQFWPLFGFLLAPFRLDFLSPPPVQRAAIFAVGREARLPRPRLARKCNSVRDLLPDFF